jgi:hypothetical protein
MTSTQDGTGKGTVGFDAKVGLLVNAVITVVGLALVEWLGSLDFSTLPTFVATLAPVAIGLVANFITTKVLPRYSGGGAPAARRI